MAERRRSWTEKWADRFWSVDPWLFARQIKIWQCCFYIDKFDFYIFNLSKEFIFFAFKFFKILLKTRFCLLQDINFSSFTFALYSFASDWVFEVSVKKSSASFWIFTIWPSRSVFTSSRFLFRISQVLGLVIRVRDKGYGLGLGIRVWWRYGLGIDEVMVELIRLQSKIIT